MSTSTFIAVTAGLTIAVTSAVCAPAAADEARVHGAFIMQNDHDGQQLSWAAIGSPGSDDNVDVSYHSAKPAARSTVEFPAMNAGSHGPIRGAGPFAGRCFTNVGNSYRWETCNGSAAQDFEWQESDKAGKGAAGPRSKVLKNTNTPIYIGKDFPLGPTSDERDANIIHVTNPNWDGHATGRIEGPLIFQHNVDGDGWSWGWVEPPKAIGYVTVHYSPTRPSETHGALSFPEIAHGSRGTIRGTGSADRICLTEYPFTAYQWQMCDGSPAQEFYWTDTNTEGLDAAVIGAKSIRSVMSNKWLGDEAPLRPTDVEAQGNIVKTSGLVLNNLTVRITAIDHQARSVSLTGKTGQPNTPVGIHTPDGSVRYFTSNQSGVWEGTVTGLNSGENVLWATQYLDGVPSSPLQIVAIVDPLAVPLADPLIIAGLLAALLAAGVTVVYVRRRRAASL